MSQPYHCQVSKISNFTKILNLVVCILLRVQVLKNGKANLQQAFEAYRVVKRRGPQDL
jgi:hypothetical protein